MSKKLKFGIIGCGNQGSAYASFIEDGLVPSMELVAICDIDSKQTDKLSQKYPAKEVFSDYKALIDSGLVEAIVTTVPHYLHPEIAMYAISKGVHVLNEKPAGVYTKQVKELNAFAAKHPDVTYAIMFNQRNNPLYQRIKQIVDNGEIGAIRRTNWIITTWYRPDAYYGQSEWRATWGAEGGGVLVNQAPHQLDLIQWIAGVPKAVYAKAAYGYKRDIAVEDEVTAVLDYGNGATGVFITATHDILGTDRLEIFGDKGKIIVEDSKKVTVKRLYKSEQEINAGIKASGTRFEFPDGKQPNEIAEEEVFTTDSVWGAQHSGVLENFARHILHGEPLLAPGADGIHGVRLANAIHLSSWLGKEVSLEDFDDDLYLSMLNEKIEEEGKYAPKP
ncbi:Gfo/Idh/MocA family protein [Fundicoccus culcitae]|uniref:Gfo/Idh/MocA family oxidoreductase n=1 Tax=Fundicoccus culcitae TaxID=2969821 RepID=A0ABY5P6P8_9LACT|nr:Gfo/Idh/MocA family oxidoreductase [Fundicoccus culcitae]UUX34412.1 Gfo/Idh/MocA family oxidoreductase [Fundicoccus culcitae]